MRAHTPANKNLVQHRSGGLHVQLAQDNRLHPYFHLANGSISGGRAFDQDHLQVEKLHFRAAYPRAGIYPPVRFMQG